jgi:hypothetical protein
MGSKVVENIKKRLLNKLSNPPKNDYFDNWEDNLLDDIDKNLVELDLTDGSGNELNKKFKAIHSSSALCVNNFGIFKDKELIKDFKIIGETEFINSILFEEKLATGLQGTKPNLDAYLENLNSIIGIESKFTEYFVKKKASFEPSYNKENLGYLPNEVFDLIEKYSNKTGYLDVAQLLKHSIGLINKVINSPEKK